MKDALKTSTKYLKIFCNLLFAVICVFLIVYILPKLIVYFMPFVIGFLLSLIANPVVHFLEKRIKIKRKYGSVLMIVGVIALIVLICYGLISALANGIGGFIDYIPELYKNASIELSKAAGQLQTMINKLPLKNDVDFTQIGDMLGSLVTGLLSSIDSESVSAISDIAKRIPDILFGVIIGLLATYFFTTDHDKIIKIVKEKFPIIFHETFTRVYYELVHVVGGYFKAQFKIMGVTYVLLTIGLAILKVKYAWIIAFGIAFLDMLPVFGTGAVLWPWALIKLLSGNYQIALGMMILYAVCQVTHQLVQPKLIGDSVGMDPFATLFFMYIGYRIKGVLGMIIAIPAGMILYHLYLAGAFDTVIWCFKEIAKDFNEFRKI